MGLGGLVALCLAFPACSSTLSSLLALTAAVGVTYSIAFGTSHQLVPRFTQRSTVALNTGACLDAECLTQSKIVYVYCIQSFLAVTLSSISTYRAVQEKAATRGPDRPVPLQYQAQCEH